MEEYAKPRTRRERLSYWKIGLTTMAATQELLSVMLLVLLKKKNSSAYGTVIFKFDNWTWTGTTQCPTVQLIRPTEYRKTQHSMSRWHRTVHIPWLVDSYDTHKGKRWLNSNPQTTGPNRRKRINGEILHYACEGAHVPIQTYKSFTTRARGSCAYTNIKILHYTWEGAHVLTYLYLFWSIISVNWG